jgi:hypothetical protein
MYSKGYEQKREWFKLRRHLPACDNADHESPQSAYQGLDLNPGPRNKQKSQDILFQVY